MIREAYEDELQDLLHLYLHLHEEQIPDLSQHMMHVWNQIIHDTNHHVIVAWEEGRIVSSCICVIIPNLTRNASPYALIENVVTDKSFRGRGLASSCLEYAISIAKTNHCYKAMLLTGSKEASTLDFYKNAGFNSEDKTGFVQKF